MTSNNNTTEHVSALISTLARGAPGAVDMLLRGALAARPNDQDLHEFARLHFPSALEPIDDNPNVQDAQDQQLVNAINRALIGLNEMKPREDFQQIMASYRSAFEETRKQITVLAKYKELHNCLHEIQRSLNDIARDIDRLRNGDNVQRYLKDRASFLKQWARTARNQLPDLPTKEDDKVWVDQLDSCAADMRAAALPNTTIGDSEKALQIPARLGRILANSSRINYRLVSASKRVRLDNFSETICAVEQQLRQTMSEDTLSRLRAGLTAVGQLRSRLAGLVAEHDEWQELNADLELAKTSPLHQPQAKFASRWTQFRGKLVGLCDIFPSEEWSVELKKTLSQWPDDEPPPEPQIPRNIAQIEDDFLTFYQQCIDRFIEVDTELNELCRKITQFNVPLNALLRM